MKMRDTLQARVPHTAAMLDGIFGHRAFSITHPSVGVLEMDTEALVMDYLKLLVRTKEPLPILAIGGQHRSAGRTTFLNWLLSIMPKRSASFVADLNSMVLMRGFRLVALDSVELDEPFHMDLKMVASAIGGPVVVLTTNMDPKPLRVTTPHRMWCLEARPVAIPDREKLKKLDEELPAFHAMLSTYTVQSPRCSPTYFSTTLQP